MHINNTIFKELLKRGYSYRRKKRIWDLSDSKLWYLTPELSEGFLNLAKYEPYRKVVVERELLLVKKHTATIAKFFGGKKFNLIDLGCGGGLKTREFIRSLPNDVRLRYCPVDISEYFINKCTKRIRILNSKKVTTIRPFFSDFKDFNEIVGILRNGEYERNIVLLLGETISHYDINEFLFQLSRDMFKGCVLVIGNGYRVGRRFVHIEKYKDKLFNQWFIHILINLGFKESEVKYDARFAHGRLEFFYTINVNKKIKYLSKTVVFRKGDEIIIGIQYKFYPRELQRFAKMYFSEIKFLPDKVGEYCLLVCKK